MLASSCRAGVVTITGHAIAGRGDGQEMFAGTVVTEYSNAVVRRAGADGIGHAEDVARAVVLQEQLLAIGMVMVASRPLA